MRRVRSRYAVVCVTLLICQPLFPATIEVNETCTLVDAINAANNDDDSGGSCAPGGSGADTLVLTDDVALDAVDNGNNGLPVITSDVTIEGNGFQIVRSAVPERFRLFDVQVALTLNRVTLRNGYGPRGGGVYVRGGQLTLQDSAVISSAAASGGGGIAAMDGTVTIRNSTLSGSRATTGGGLWSYDSHVSITNGTIEDNDARDGGALWAYSTGERDLAVEDSLFRGNAAVVNGGAIALDGGVELTVEHTTLDENQAGNKGGAIFADTTSGFNLVTILNSTLERNTAEDNGGAVFSRYGEFVIRNSTLTGNVAGFNLNNGLGGAIAVQNGSALVESSAVLANTATLGGGIYASGFDGSPNGSPARLTLMNSTVSGNAASDSGGGLLSAFGSTIDVVHSTLFGNAAPSASQIEGTRSPGPTSLTGTIVAGGVGGDACSGTAIDGSANFADVLDCGPAEPIDPGVDIETTLADNGGPTETHALTRDSVARDAAGNCGLETDQRGAPRDDGACDAGSFEVQPLQAGACCIAPNSQRVCMDNFTLDECDARRGLFAGPGTDCGDPLACDLLLVAIDSMAALATDLGVELSWTTAVEIDTAGFRVLRETGHREKSLQLVASLPAMGNDLEGHSYTLLDDAPEAARARRYFLEDIDIFGRVTRHGPIIVHRGARHSPPWDARGERQQRRARPSSGSF